MISVAISSSPAVWSAVGLVIIFYWGRNRSKLPLPPGPRKLPILGNLLDMPPDSPWKTYLRWSKEFDSDIIHVNVAGTSIIVLHSMEAIRDLLDRRASRYSDRPRAPMLNDLMGWADFAFGFMDHGYHVDRGSIGDRWRSHRKMFHETFHIGAARKFNHQVRAATHDLLRRVLQNPNEMMGHFRHLAGALIMNVTYGIEVQASNDPYIKLAEEPCMGCQSRVSREHSLFTKLMYYQDIIPALKYVPSWFPGADFQRKATQWRTVTSELVEVPFREAKRNIAAGTAPSSFISLNLPPDECQGKEREAKEQDVKQTAGATYAAGSDTTVSAMGTFVLAMIKSPEAQKKAQAELDRVIGHGRLPDFADEPALPYLSAVVKEVLRWENVAPIGIPHRLSDGEDDEYKGYRIPAGSIVIGNTWFAMSFKMYPDPESFIPERFLRDGKLDPDVRDPETAAFGYGRRICPGRHIASTSLWITIASVLATMEITKAVDENGKELEPSYEYFSALVFSPLPFKCTITPRSQQAVDAIEATVDGG
ncbi:cytochrome P450 [Mycena rosella]|uniref:Cytochrome P450 n=1 Tax=Mycena rosella TaxID=1033263 RepID=A0AAD7G922_MYCRO|nr:cytochrome P450 [Mycena rosella]